MRSVLPVLMDARHELEGVEGIRLQKGWRDPVGYFVMDGCAGWGLTMMTRLFPCSVSQQCGKWIKISGCRSGGVSESRTVG